MSKLVSMHDAVSAHIPDGSSVALGLQMEQMIPFSAGHEMMRQHKRDLTLIGPIFDIIADQLIGAGCVREVIGAWIGNVMMGSAYNFRREVESGRVKVTNLTNFSVALALQAGAMGVPFLPMRSALGTDIPKGNRFFTEIEDPFASSNVDLDNEGLDKLRNNIRETKALLTATSYRIIRILRMLENEFPGTEASINTISDFTRISTRTVQRAMNGQIDVVSSKHNPGLLEAGWVKCRIAGDGSKLYQLTIQSKQFLRAEDIEAESARREQQPHLVKVRSSELPVGKLHAVKALVPDVTIMHVQRADAEGNAHCWGNFGVMLEGVRAAKKVIVIAEEIVAPEVISSDPNRTVIPSFLVSAVVESPVGAHPSPVQGYYKRDDAFFMEYHRQSKTQADFDHWAERWVHSLQDREAYKQQLGAERVASLGVKKHAYAAQTDYGY